MPSLTVALEPGKTVHVKLVKANYVTQEFDYTVPSSAATVTKTMYLEKGTLNYTTTPTGATIKVYKAIYGKSCVASKGELVTSYTTPGTVDLIPGRYCIVISKAGYTDWNGEVTITAGKTVSGTVTLTLQKGTLSVATTPTGATVKVGTETKTAPCNFSLAPGTYTVTVSKPDYDTITDSVTINAGETTTKSYTLTLSKVTITFETKKEDGSTLTGVEVYIDGVSKGVT